MACICVQFIICGWSLAMRENLPTSVEIFIDDSFVEFLDKFSRTKVDNLHLWNRMQSQVSPGFGTPVRFIWHLAPCCGNMYAGHP